MSPQRMREHAMWNVRHLHRHAMKSVSFGLMTALEHKLTDEKIDLPSDGRVAQPPGSSGNTQ